MKYPRILVLCFNIITVTMVSSTPLKIQLLPVLQQPVQEPTPQAQVSLQQELQALQMLQAMQRINNQQPLTLGLPSATQFFIPQKTPMFANIFEKPNTEEETQNTKTAEKGDFDSVFVDAEPNIENDEEMQTRRVLLVLNAPTSKQGRFGIGDIISLIPFLPIEINVIDAATWAYNGIANIISIIGSIRPPFGRPQNPMQKDINKSIILNTLLKAKESSVPMMALPVNVQMSPFQNTVPYRPLLPIQV